MSAIPQPTGPDPKPINIGEVLKLLTPEFPDITLSKIRYLESEGLVSPQRTSSGYRKYTNADVERLRYVLTIQQETYMPLKEIKKAAGCHGFPLSHSHHQSRNGPNHY